MPVELDQGLGSRRSIGLKLGRVSVQPCQILVAALFVGASAFTGVLLALMGGARPVFGVFLNSLGRSFSREQLLSSVWGSSSDWQSAETVSEHVYRLRQKLGLGSERPRIATVRGIGYRCDP